MSAVIEFVQARGEYASLLTIAVLLWLSAGATARLVALRRSEVTDLFFNGGIAFVVAGRLAYVLAETPRTLLDPLVLVRVQGGIEPLAGVIGVAGVLGWYTRGRAVWPWLAAAAAGLAIATVGYDLSCVIRDACYGAAAPAPLGFAMSGFSEPRMATPLIEATVVLAAGAALLAFLGHLRFEAAPLLLIAILAFVRAALTPVSALGGDAVGLETVLLVLTGLVALAVDLLLQLSEQRNALRGSSLT